MTLPATSADIPSWILWAHSAKGDVQNAQDLLRDALAMIENGDYPEARYNLIQVGSQLDKATQALVQALR